MIRQGGTIDKFPNDSTGTRRVEPESAVVDDGGSARARWVCRTRLKWYRKKDPGRCETSVGLGGCGVRQQCFLSVPWYLRAIDQMVYVIAFGISEGTWEL